MPKSAWITLRHSPHYRSDRFAEGFEELGFKVHMVFPDFDHLREGDVVVTWNLNPRFRGVAEAALSANCALIVAENGYLPRRGEQWYALARNGHNGSGFWYVGDTDRWSALGHKIHPWNSNREGYILICGQRGIGSEIMRSPNNFVDTTRDKVVRIFKRVRQKNVAIKFRHHPGRHQSKVPLSHDFVDAKVVVSWASNVLNEAILAGIPAFRLSPYHVNDAVMSDLSLMPDPPEPDRNAAFHKLSWAQWNLSEIGSGEAFRYLLQDLL